MDDTDASTWRREVGRRTVSFVRVLGELITRYETNKRATSGSGEDSSRAEIACDLALDELERLSVALKQLRRSLHE